MVFVRRTAFPFSPNSCHSTVANRIEVPCGRCRKAAGNPASGHGHAWTTTLLSCPDSSANCPKSTLLLEIFTFCLLCSRFALNFPDATAHHYVIADRCRNFASSMWLMLRWRGAVRASPTSQWNMSPVSVAILTSPRPPTWILCSALSSSSNYIANILGIFDF
ncbi:hypothetical protein BJY01DRAFT_212749 [Aspergillus pseudoustus]|uniref:Uncharacterized protein n=1 Tax=Aspergillus pseudoustus TaxID=1810923 RepID=A0ABR4K7I0_9EURO